MRHHSWRLLNRGRTSRKLLRLGADLGHLVTPRLAEHEEEQHEDDDHDDGPDPQEHRHVTTDGAEHARADGVDGEDADGSPGGPDCHGATTGAVREPDRHAGRPATTVVDRPRPRMKRPARNTMKSVAAKTEQMTWPMIARIMPVHVAILGPHLRTRMDVGNAMMRRRWARGP